MVVRIVWLSPGIHTCELLLRIALEVLESINVADPLCPRENTDNQKSSHSYKVHRQKENIYMQTDMSNSPARCLCTTLY